MKFIRLENSIISEHFVTYAFTDNTIMQMMIIIPKMWVSAINNLEYFPMN